MAFRLFGRSGGDLNPEEDNDGHREETTDEGEQTPERDVRDKPRSEHRYSPGRVLQQQGDPAGRHNVGRTVNALAFPVPNSGDGAHSRVAETIESLPNLANRRLGRAEKLIQAASEGDSPGDGWYRQQLERLSSKDFKTGQLEWARREAGGNEATYHAAASRA
eukprot:scaffold2391_cov381-Prasinococcus_capsulatus_cf.AAC.6